MSAALRLLSAKRVFLRRNPFAWAALSDMRFGYANKALTQSNQRPLIINRSFAMVTKTKADDEPPILDTSSAAEAKEA